MTNYDNIAAVIGVQGSVSPPAQLHLEGADGNHLNALDWGGTGQPCLFLHGGAMSAHTWTQTCLMLREQYHCVCVDLRGHGDSAWCDDYSIASNVSDILHVLDQLAWTDPHFVGMSLGGVVAAHAVSALAEREPSSLTLVDVAPGVSFGDVGRISDFMGPEIVAQGPEALIAAARRLGASQTSAELRHRYRSLTRPHPEGGWEWKRDTRQPTDYAQILDHIEELDALAPTWSLPCLLVRGGRSRILSEDAAKAFVLKCKNGRFAAVSNAGHSVQEDNPHELTGVLQRFWNAANAEA